MFCQLVCVINLTLLAPTNKAGKLDCTDKLSGYICCIPMSVMSVCVCVCVCVYVLSNFLELQSAENKETLETLPNSVLPNQEEYHSNECYAYQAQLTPFLVC